MLDNGSHGGYTCPRTDAYDWSIRITREGNKSFRDPNKDGVTFRRNQQLQDTGKQKHTWDESRQVRRAHSFPWDLQASPVIHHRNAKMYLLREGLAFYLSPWIDQN